MLISLLWSFDDGSGSGDGPGKVGVYSFLPFVVHPGSSLIEYEGTYKVIRVAASGQSKGIGKIGLGLPFAKIS